MKVWKLKPLDPIAPDRDRSEYWEVVIVRAPSAEEARRRVGQRLFKAAGKHSGGLVPGDPWETDKLTTCVAIEDPHFSSEGPTEILYPPEYAGE